MAAHPTTIPVWTIAAPFAALAVYLAHPTGMVGAVLLAAALLVAVVAAVHHAELVAARVGDPFGAVILAVAVTIIEVGLIVSIMLGPSPQPTLVRDTVHAVVVLVLHGLAGLCIVVAALRHREPRYRTTGSQAFLTVLMPMVAVVLVLPNYTTGSAGPFYSPLQLAFVSSVCLALYVAFILVQTVRHADFFRPDGDQVGEPHARPSAWLGWKALALLVVALVAVVLLAKAFSPFIQAGVAAIGAPVALTGVIVAAIVLLPEAAAAIRAAAENRLQTSINLALGSAVASIGLTIPTVAAVSHFTGQPLTLGVDPGGTVLLALTFLTAMITYGTGRTNLLSGVVHLILFVVWIFLIFAP